MLGVRGCLPPPSGSIWHWCGLGELGTAPAHAGFGCGDPEVMAAGGGWGVGCQRLALGFAVDPHGSELWVPAPGALPCPTTGGALSSVSTGVPRGVGTQSSGVMLPPNPGGLLHVGSTLAAGWVLHFRAGGGLFVHVWAMPPQFGVGVPPPSGCCPLSPSGSDPSARLRPQQPRLREGTAPAGGHLGVPTMGLGGTCCLPSPPVGLSLLGCPAFWGCSRSPRLPLFRQRRRGPRHFLPQGTAAVGPYPHPPRPTPTETAPGG